MKTMKLASSLAYLATLPSTAAFIPHRPGSGITADIATVNTRNAMTTAISALALPSTPDKPIFDPLGLYPRNSPERLEGIIQPLEASYVNTPQEDSNWSKNDETNARNPVFDPLGLYKTNRSSVSSSLSSAVTDVVSTVPNMSSSIPFLPRPTLLDGTLPGDRGFDPFNFASNSDSLMWQRRAELKHGRLAMLASVGWPVAELFHLKLAETLDLPYSLASGGRVPSILNDGLAHADFPIFWLAVLSAAAAIEIFETVGEAMYPVEMGYDVLSSDNNSFRFESAEIVYEDEIDEKPSHFIQEAEIFNGRLGMLAITTFAIQECLQNSAVVSHWLQF